MYLRLPFRVCEPESIDSIASTNIRHLLPGFNFNPDPVSPMLTVSDPSFGTQGLFLGVFLEASILA